MTDVPPAQPSPRAPAQAPVDYRLAPLVVARLVGLYLVVLAVLLVTTTVLISVLDGPLDVLVLVLGLGLVGLFGGAWWLRGRAYVVRLDEAGYAVRMVRGAGVRDGRWSDVEGVVAESPGAIACLVLRRHDGTTTTVPVDALAVDRDRFAHDVRDRLEHAARARS